MILMKSEPVNGIERALVTCCDDYQVRPLELPRLLEKMSRLLPK